MGSATPGLGGDLTILETFLLAKEKNFQASQRKQVSIGVFQKALGKPQRPLSDHCLAEVSPTPSRQSGLARLKLS